METKYFSLGSPDSGIAIKIIRILFGLVCMAISVFWIIFNIRSVQSDRTLWITVLFLSGFGLYQVCAGLGRTRRYIQIDNEKIMLKKNSLLPVTEMKSSEISKIEVYPLNLIFYFHKGGRKILRFGTAYTDIIDPVKDETEKFATSNNIGFEIVAEEL
jgi:hypothetical protein